MMFAELAQKADPQRSGNRYTDICGQTMTLLDRGKSKTVNKMPALEQEIIYVKPELVIRTTTI